MSDAPSSSSNGPSAVPWDDVVRFVRQLSHDLRNHLNAAELQSVFLNELATDAEMKGEIKRLREMISQLGTVLQKLSGALAQPKVNLMPYRASDFMEDTRQKFEQDFPDGKAAVNWEVAVGDAMLDVDPQLLQQAVFELIDNAARYGAKGSAITISARIEKDQFVLQLREPKSSDFAMTSDGWAREPMRRVGHGHYGLGLNRVNAIVQAHSGQFSAEHDSATSSLISTILLPLSRGES